MSYDQKAGVFNIYGVQIAEAEVCRKINEYKKIKIKDALPENVKDEWDRITGRETLMAAASAELGGSLSPDMIREIVENKAPARAAVDVALLSILVEKKGNPYIESRVFAAVREDAGAYYQHKISLFDVGVGDDEVYYNPELAVA
ncbi:MAG: hypothetical protein KDI13_07720 [Alphaproteobacteria bacterium]|nr:hypothetical protein [Alphaproteobacteria bacterium]